MTVPTATDRFDLCVPETEVRERFGEGPLRHPMTHYHLYYPAFGQVTLQGQRGPDGYVWYGERWMTMREFYFLPPTVP